MGELEGKRVLLVDDDPEIIVAMKTVFEESGAAVVTAMDGDAALAMAEEHELDLIILDAMLPKRSGFLVLERMKSKAGKRNPVPIIMITGNEGKRHQTWARSLGVADYINKPFRMDRLLQSAEKVLSS